MRRAFCWLLLFLITVIAACLLKLGAPGPTSRLSVGEGAKTSVQRSALPLSFEINRGQADNRVKFLAHGESYGLFLTPQSRGFVAYLLDPSRRQHGRELDDRRGDARLRHSD